ncbi:DUF4863 domain-containing protein [Xenophilus aerolatus]|nr:DUF4863 domain-containing protein [Xenophilus aerolatus]
MTTTSTPETSRALLVDFASALRVRPLDASLQAWLNTPPGPQSPTFTHLKAACEAGVDAGWLRTREAGDICYGRIFKPADDLARFSVDVVEMRDVAEPDHTHPHCEIDLIKPPDLDARFDQHPAGWLVYPPGSAHLSNVSQGRALVSYLLPEGQVQFS